MCFTEVIKGKHGGNGMEFHEKPASYVSDLTLKVQDLKRSKEFYCNVMGFTVFNEEDSRIVFTVNGVDPILTIKTFPLMESIQPRRTGLYHFAVLLPKRKDLAKFIRNIILSDYPLHGASDHGVSEALYLSDPDGNGIEVYYDRPSEKWVWNQEEVHMISDQLDIADIMTNLDGTTWDKAPKNTVLGHIHLHVKDLTESEYFYKELLGLDVVCRYGGQALFVSFNKYHHHIGLNIWNGIGAPAPEADSVGLDYYTIKYADANLLQEAVQKLEKAQVNIEKIGSSYFVCDPSRNKIELTV